jgi:2-methylcitrate dehydratase PrpD
LREAECANALGVAASLSAGVIENLSTAAKNVGVGNAARNGLLAAMMAARGYEAGAQALEGPLGWSSAAGDRLVTTKVLDGLGERWEVLANTYKPYPSGIVFHAIIDACLELRERHALDPSMIERMDVWGDELMLARGNREVRTERDARVSIQHAAAVALATGRAGEAEFSMSSVRHPAVAALRSRVTPGLDSTLPRGAARVRAILTDGRAVSSEVLHAKGSQKRPLSDADLEAKVGELAGSTGIDGRKLADAVWNIDTMTDIAGLMQLLRLDA